MSIILNAANTPDTNNTANTVIDDHGVTRDAATNAVAPLTGTETRLPTGVVGRLFRSNRADRVPTAVNKSAVEKALDAVGAGHLIKHLPLPTTVGRAIENAISRTKKPLAAANMEWTRLGEKDSSGNEVLLLLAITEDANAQNIDARKLAAALIDKNGTFYGVPGSALMQPTVDAFKAAFDKEYGVMENGSFWQTVLNIALEVKGTAPAQYVEGFHTSDGEVFAHGQAEQDLLLLNHALARVEGCSYRLRGLVFRPEDNAAEVAGDAMATIVTEMKEVKEEFAARKKAAAEKGKAHMNTKGLYGTVDKIVSLSSRAKLLAMVTAQESAEFAKMHDELKEDARAALIASM